MGTTEPGSPTERFQCPSCPKSFARSFGLKEHLLITHVQDAETYPCEKCIGKDNLPKTFKTKRTFQAHLLQVHGPRDRFKCSVCFKISTNSSNHRKHLLTHNQTIPKKYKCEFCSTTIGTKQHFHEHLFSVHKKKTPGVKYFKCELCSIEFVSNFFLEKHVLDKHVVDKEFKCTFCVNAFIDQPTLDKHIKYHHTPNKLVCDVCYKGFKEKAVFRLHLEKEHSKLFYCSKCSTSFSDKSEFDQHLGPKSSASSSSILKTELICATCSSSFDSQCNLSIHTNCHLMEIKLEKPNDEIKSVSVVKVKIEPQLPEAPKTKKVFKCCTCKLHFNSLWWLLEHRRRIHSDKFQSQKQTSRNIEFSDGVVYICSSSNCRFDTGDLKEVAIHYNEQHQLPKVKVVIMYPSLNGGPKIKMENKSLNTPSSSSFSKNTKSKTKYKKKAERIIQRRYKCEICSRLFKRISDLKPHQGTHSKLS